MILQSLNQLYDRLTTDPDYEIAPGGYSTQKIAFVVVLHPDGRLYEIQDVRDTSTGRPIPIQRLLPGQAKSSGPGFNPCFLWDNTDYMLGYSSDEKKSARAALSFNSYKEKHCDIEKELDLPEYSAVCRFLENWDMQRTLDFPFLQDITSGFGVFQIVGAPSYIHENSKVREWWEVNQKKWVGEEEGQKQMCLVSGNIEPVARKHEPAIKGVKGPKSSAKIFSFKPDSFDSYGKKQGLNAPVSERVAFRYCTALNALLDGPRSNKHHFQVGDTTVAFWTEQPTETEDWLAQMFSGNLEEAQDDNALQRTRVLLQALRNGSGELRALGDDPATPVHILGLAPNAGRLSVRFWHTGSLGELFDKLKAHHDALRVVRQFEEGSKRPDLEFPPAWMLLRETARESKDISPLLAGALMRAIFEGTPYPDTLANAVIRRIRADRHINYLRAAILKAWLTRKPNYQGGVPVSLDIERLEPGYRLGRLFAALEKTQERAQPGINSTIRERFYSSASATPAMVFPRILRTYQHHLAKLHPGEKVNREKLIQEIMDGIFVMPPHLNLESQALFAIGYYHQRKALFGGGSEHAQDNNEQKSVNEEQE